ncbi:hypothetical protein GTO27_06905 [Candidatus Bathyarchaeota archaeon]|nr:hypothetical protein [Candidatus Bathyarchaeota archaeon]
MRDEVVDQVVYFQVLEEQQEEVMTKLEHALQTLKNKEYSSKEDQILDATVFVQQAWNILEHGNEDGTPEEEK